MKHYKDKNNKLHFIAGGFEHLLPPDCVEVTTAEAVALLQPTAAEIAAERKAEILALLQGLDLKSVRPLREGNNSLVAQLEAQAAVLRIELSELPV